MTQLVAREIDVVRKHRGYMGEGQRRRELPLLTDLASHVTDGDEPYEVLEYAIHRVGHETKVAATFALLNVTDQGLNGVMQRASAAAAILGKKSGDSLRHSEQYTDLLNEVTYQLVKLANASGFEPAPYIIDGSLAAE